MDLRDKTKKYFKPNKPMFLRFMYCLAWVCTLSLFSMYFFNPLGNTFIRPLLLRHPEILHDTIAQTQKIILLMAICYAGMLLATAWTYYKKD